MIEHIVFIRWKDGTPRDQIDAALRHAFAMEAIEGIAGVTCRRTLGTNKRDKEITDVMIVKMVDHAAMERFGPHPLHQASGEHMMPLVDDVTIVNVAS